MEKKTFSIGILSLSAVILLVANFMPLPRARADQAIKERDFTLVTARIALGGEALYVVDNRTGQIAVFAWDAQARTVRLKEKRPILEMFRP